MVSHATHRAIRPDRSTTPLVGRSWRQSSWTASTQLLRPNEPDEPLKRANARQRRRTPTMVRTAIAYPAEPRRESSKDAGARVLGLFVSEKCHDHIGGHHQNRGVAVDHDVPCQQADLVVNPGG